MNRRGFLGSIIALAAAPAIVSADSLMKIKPAFDDWAYLMQCARLGIPAQDFKHYNVHKTLTLQPGNNLIIHNSTVNFSGQGCFIDASYPTCAAWLDRLQLNLPPLSRAFGPDFLYET
jgi:hypothetical protein